MSVKQAAHKAYLFLFKNTNLRQTVLKNAFWLFSSKVMGHAIRAIIVIYAARVLGTAGFGTASYALSFAGIFMIIADMGMGSVLTKEMIQNPDKRERYFATAFSLRSLFALISFLAIAGIGPLITRIPEAVALLPLAALTLIFDSMRNLAIAFIHAKEKMEWEAGLMLFTNLMTVLIGVGILTVYMTPAGMLYGYAIGSGIGFFAAFFALRGHIKKTVINFDRAIAIQLLKQSLPLVFMGLLGGTMLNIDAIMIGWWKGAVDVGLYAAAQKPIQIAYGFALVAGGSLLPALSRVAREDGARFTSVLRQVMRPVIAVSAITSIICVIFAKELLVLVYGAAYAPAAGTFIILALTIAINAPIIIGFNAIIAAGKQKIYLWSAPVEAISNIVLNTLFIPRFGIEGAALSTLITQLVVNAYLWKKIREL